MGSANINDRSQKGDGDSEIAMVVDDNDLIETTMDGKPVGLFVSLQSHSSWCSHEDGSFSIWQLDSPQR